MTLTDGLVRPCAIAVNTKHNTTQTPTNVISGTLLTVGTNKSGQAALTSTTIKAMVTTTSRSVVYQCTVTSIAAHGLSWTNKVLAVWSIEPLVAQTYRLRGSSRQHAGATVVTVGVSRTVYILAVLPLPTGITKALRVVHTLPMCRTFYVTGQPRIARFTLAYRAVRRMFPSVVAG